MGRGRGLTTTGIREVPIAPFFILGFLSVIVAVIVRVPTSLLMIVQSPVGAISLLIRPALSSLGQPPEFPPALGPAHLTRSTGVRSGSRSTRGSAKRGRPAVPGRARARPTTLLYRLERMGRHWQPAVPVQTGRRRAGLPPVRAILAFFPLVGLDPIHARKERIRFPRSDVRFSVARLIKGLRLFGEDGGGHLIGGDVFLFFVGRGEEFHAV